MGASYSFCDAPRNPAFPDLTPASTTEDTPPAKSTPPYPSVVPPPVKYEELSREALQALKWETICGANFSLTKPLNQNFFLSHRFNLGSREVEAEGGKILRATDPDYNFGATVANEKFLLMGTVAGSGVLTSRAQLRPTEELTLKYESRIQGAGYPPMFMGDVEYCGKDWNGQLKTGYGGFYGANYMQNITHHVSLGGEVFYLSAQNRSGVGLAARLIDDKSVSTLQIASTGILSLTYFHRLNDKHSLASDFLLNVNAPHDAIASVGYDYFFRQCRLRGSVDSNFKIQALLEESLAPGVKLQLSGVLDHSRHDHAFGFGMTFGE